MDLLPFNRSDKPTLGLEWELALVDPVTRDLVPRAPEIVQRVAETHPDIHIEREFLANTVELVTSVCETVPEAVEELRRAGRRVPEDVLVGGFDDSSFALTTEPALTTMRQPFRRISAEMVRLLLDAVEGQDPAAVILPTTLVVRGSTARA